MLYTVYNIQSIFLDLILAVQSITVYFFYPGMGRITLVSKLLYKELILQVILARKIHRNLTNNCHIIIREITVCNFWPQHEGSLSLTYTILLRPSFSMNTKIKHTQIHSNAKNEIAPLVD